MPGIVLASSSPYRRALLDQLRLDYTSASPDIDETALPAETAEALTLRLAVSKAEALQARFPRHLIVGSDQVALLEGKPVSKPGNYAAAFEQLKRSSGQCITFATAVCLLNSHTGVSQSAVEHFDVTFRPLSDEQIDRYLRTEEPYDCAGSFKVEGLGISLFESLRGDDPNCLIGLPLIRLCQMFANEGIEIP